MKISELFSLIKSDFVRLGEFWGIKLRFLTVLKLIILPAMFAIIIYRISNYLYLSKLRFLSWPLYALNITITGADIHPSCRIGRGFILGHPTGTVITARIGDSVTIFGKASIGGGLGQLTKDVGAGPGLPYIENNVQIGFNATILGAVVIGEEANIAPCTFIRKSVPSRAIAFGNPAVIREAKSSRKKIHATKEDESGD